MTAKEMFEKLGYEEVDDHINIINKKTYRTLWGIYEDYLELLEVATIDKKLKFKYIEFSQLSKYRGININLQVVDAEVKDEELKVKMFGEAKEIPKGGVDITFEELQAINQQCKELGW